MGFIESIKDRLKCIIPPSINIFHHGINDILTQFYQHYQYQQQEFNLLQRYLESINDTGTNALHQIEKHFADSNTNNQKTLNYLEQQQIQLQKQIAQLQFENKQLQDDINKLFNDLKQRQENLTQQLKHTIPNQTVYWNNQYEKNIVIANWGDVSEREDFSDKFLRLTSGLESESIEKIIRILVRQKKYLNSRSEQLDLFTRAEQEELRLLNENFYAEILKLSDHLFAYKSYLLPVNHFEPSVFYYKHGLNEVRTLHMVKGKSIIDVGGFIGDSVLILSELKPDKIYTFEAMPDNLELLKQTIKLNHIENVIVENSALGASNGIVTMHEAGSGSTLIDRPGIVYQKDIEVSVTTLDEYVVGHRIEVGLIKVDIEGGEPGFLEGAKQTICKQKPILLLSIYHNAHDFFELKPLIESWNVGYKFRIHKPTYGSATGETLLLAEIVD